MDIQKFLFNQNDNIYNNFPDAIIVINFMRNIVVWNKRAELLFGYTEKEIKNSNIKVIFNEDYEKLNKIIGLTHGNILRATTKNNEVIFVDVTAYDAHSSAKTVISVRAVSEKFMMLQGLLEAYQQTKELVSNRDSFFSNLKFDFVTPLNAAIGFSQSLLDNVCGELNAKQKKYISIINTNIKKVNAMMEKVFYIIALDAGKKEFNFKSFDFIKVFNFLEETFSIKAKEKNLKIEFHNEVERRNVFSDEYAVIHIMSYLIENAVKFTENGGIEVAARYPDIMFLETHGIKIPSGYNEKSYIHLYVKDSGIGIDEEHIATIFDEYNIKNNQVVKKYGGTALSLPICNKLVQKLSGIIWCESDEETGSIFHVIIPIERMSFEQ